MAEEVARFGNLEVWEGVNLVVPCCRVIERLWLVVSAFVILVVLALAIVRRLSTSPTT
jgi:hypothetical protein